jgi:vacuolar-type H+-ATPase subunit E/Vma4
MSASHWASSINKENIIGGIFMPTIDDKLNAFNKSILDSAINSSKQIRGKLRQDSDQKLTGIKDEIKSAAEKDYLKGLREATIKRDSRVSTANINIRKSLMRARSEIMDTVLRELSESLAVFTQTAAYGDFLLKNIREAMAGAGMRYTGMRGAGSQDAGSQGVGLQGAGSQGAGLQGADMRDADDGGDGFRLYLTSRDYDAFRGEAQKIAPKIKICRCDADIIGGAIVENTREGIFADNTLKRKEELCADELMLVSGFIIDK